ncbi:hypothetical protein CMI47_03665 [Candidatus Pacearchaeota archaeon]|jgi:hypothetical protein|nr:hypothetical protein [Candidatus Pacearchaeota archaeon]|tara:strand:+ start:39 stop:398 length:360 start_codon:yes stop_codon:yes gene_type:complete
MTEEQVHLGVLTFLRMVLPSAAAATLQHSPNESPSGYGWRAKMQRLGTMPGWPDLEFVYNERAYFVEVKAPKGRVSAVQLATHRHLTHAGARVGVARSIDDAQALLEAWELPLRAKVAA